MKFLSKRNKFLTEEAKLKDVILPRQAKAVESKWGSEWLEYEEIEPTDKIQQGVWKLDHEDKMEIFSEFFNADVAGMYELFKKLPDQFAKALNESVSFDLLGNQTSIMPEKAKVILEDFNIQFPSIDAICILSKPIFRKISVSETKATEVIARDEKGIPLKDENNKIVKRTKEPGEIIYSRNLVNINTFVDDYNDCFPTQTVNSRIFSTGDVSSVINLAAEDLSGGSYEVDYNPFSKDMFLKIQHNPKDILNMSVSKYYSSCQHLYTGMYRQKVIGNVFDPNTVPAFIVFESPIMWKDEKISDHLPLCRMMIRNMESFDPNDPVMLFFDRCYPDRCKDSMDKIVEKYTQMKSTASRIGRPYYFTPDLPESAVGTIDAPYMDRLSIEEKRYIGVNTKSITLTPNIDWSEVKISKNAKLKEIIIQSSVLPQGFLDIPMEPDWIKFKYMRLNNLQAFSKMDTDSLAFDKCQLRKSVFDTMSPDVKKLQLISCEIEGGDLSSLKNIEELHLVYTIEDDQLIPMSSGLNLKKIVVSGDLLSTPENKTYMNNLKKKGVKIEIFGPTL
jgi:hypothetical protein